MRLTRALWAILAIGLVAALSATWWMTPPEEPEPAWVGAVSVFTGDGRDGWRDGLLDAARFSEPFGVAMGPDGVVFVSDAGVSHRIRRIGADGVVTTVAGGERGFADGPGAQARLATPSALALASDGALVVADTGNHAIRRMAPDGAVTTVAGDGVAGYRDGPAAQARFNAPLGVALDVSGRIIVADTYNDRIRVIDPDGQVRTLAGGSAAGYVDGPGPDARFDTPCGVAVDRAGRVLVADTGNGLIRVIGVDGVVTTMPSPIVSLERPMAVASAANGDIYVVDERGAIVLLPEHGEARLIAGGATGFADGVGSDARFRRPSGLALWVGPASPRVGPALRAGRRHLLVADAGNAMVRIVKPRPNEVVGTPRRGVRPAVGWSWPWSDVALPSPPPPRVSPEFDAEAFARTPLLWPVTPLDGPHEVAGTFGEARGDAGQERFHAGLDVREEQGTFVHAVRDGIVSSPIATAAFDTLNESIRIGPLAYIHIRVGRPKAEGRMTKAVPDLQRFAPVYDSNGVMTRMRAKRGAFFATGDVVGSVNAFNHVHLNVGWSGEEYNPLGFRLVQFRDSIAPTIAAAGVRVFDEAWQPLNPDRQGRDASPRRPTRLSRSRPPTRLPPLEPVVIRGRVRIVVDAWDQADGNTAYRRLGVYAVGYSVHPVASAGRTSNAERRTPNSGSLPPGAAISGMAAVTQRFDRMRRDAESARQVYATGSGIPVYGAKRTQFLYVATTGYHDGIATPGFWDTTTMAPGAYVLRVFVEDFSGNRTTRDLKVVVVP